MCDSNIKNLVSRVWKTEDLRLDAGQHNLDEIVLLHISGAVTKYVDHMAAPTVSIPLILTLALFWEKAGIARDHALRMLREAITEAMENGKCKDEQIEARMKDIDATTWELFRLIRGLEMWHWPSSSVSDLFFRKGRVAAVPSHYSRVGSVAHYYDELGVVSIQLDGESPLNIGDTIAVVRRADFFEEQVASMQIDGTDVSRASPGELVGVKTSLPRRDLPEGSDIYVARQAT